LDNEDLLRPTLDGTRDTPALYSSQAFFFTAFFGGPVAAAAYGLVNSHRLGRLRQEAAVFVGIAVAALTLFYALHELGALSSLSELMGGRQRRNYEIFMRAIALLAFGAGWLMHRRFYRAAAISGTDELPGWVPGIATGVVGALASGAFLRWIHS
jgi:hypothetical protein